MAMGRPVITTDAIGCRETVRDGYNGFLVPVRSVEALAAAMLRFIDDPELIARMGAASRQLAEERFDIDQISTTMLAAMGIPPRVAGTSQSGRGPLIEVKVDRKC
jgi:glycosyltransferase involved in cell wall biosynthesis